MSKIRRMLEHAAPRLIIALLMVALASPGRSLRSGLHAKAGKPSRKPVVTERSPDAGRRPVHGAYDTRIADPFDLQEDLEAEVEDELSFSSLPASISCHLLSSPRPKLPCQVTCIAIADVARPLRC